VGQLQVLARFQKALLKDLEPAQILRNLLEVATEEGVDRAALFLYRARTRELVGEVASGRGRHYTVSAIALPLQEPGPVQEAFFREQPLERGDECLLPVVGEEGPFCWADPERRCTARPRATRKTRPLVCPSCPRFAAKGVLRLEGVPQGLRPLLPLLSQLTALALRNGELLEERDEALARLAAQAEALRHVSALAREVAEALDPEAVLETLARALRERFGFYRVTVALVREGWLCGHLTLRGDEVFRTEGQSALRLPLATSPDPLARAVRERRAFLLGREALPPGLAQGAGPNAAFVPILREGEALGALAVDHGPGGPPIGEEALDYLELLAGVAGVALKNAQLSAALAAERRRLAQVLEELPDGVVVLLEEGGFANGKAREALALPGEVARGDLPPSLAAALEGKAVELALGGAVYSVRGRRLPGLEVLVLHDISARTRMERALREEVAFTQALAELAQAALAERGFRPLAARAGARLKALFRGDEALLALEEGGRLEVLYASSPLSPELPRPNLLEAALTQEAPRGLGGLAPGDCPLADHLGLRAALTLPFRTGAGRGVLLLGYRAPRRFGERVLARLHQVGTLLSLMAEKARFLEMREAEEARLRALLENAQDVIYVLDSQGLLRFVSESARTVLGYDPEEAKALGAWDHVHPEDRPRAQDLFAELLARPGEVRRAELKVLHRDGTPIPVEAWGRNLLQDPRIRGVVVTLRDLRPRLEAERLKGEFIAAVSHELRTPLAVILGLAELLKEEVPEGARESAELILEAAFRLKTMVDNLLDTSRLEAGRFEIARRPVDLRPRLLDLAKSFQGVARLSGVAFRVEVEPLPLLEADPERMLQVVGNLLSNAFKFTPPGGEVRLRALAQGEALVLEVADTGPGIPEEELPKLFQRYGRAQGPQTRGVAGTGLGLFISRHIVEAHGGRILVESRPGQGTTFRVILPLYGPHPGG